MTIDPRTPVLIGVAQHTVKRVQLPGPEPVMAWEQVTRLALEDAGLAPEMLSEFDGVFLADTLTWRYDDPMLRFTERLGATPNLAAMGEPSGTSPQKQMNHACSAVRSGQANFAVVCGGEAFASLKHYNKQGIMPPWSNVHADGPEYAFDIDEVQHPGEVAIGLTEGIGAVYGFAMRDIARRAHLGIAPQDYRRQLGELLAGMTRVAQDNPAAWFSKAQEADFLIDPRADNRMITYPYTKHMVAIMDVDISAAVIVTSQEWADAHDIPVSKRVYPWTSCYAHDPVYIAVRDKLWKSNAMEAASKATLAAAGLSIDDIAHIDVYSCFSAAVNFARDAMGISDRGGDQITVTGGLPYAGGPGSSYVITSIVGMVKRLRENPGDKGLISGLGWMMTNHIYAIYSTEPPPSGLQHPDETAVQAALDAIPERRIDDGYVGPATIATYTIMYDREGQPSHGAAICDLPTGDRAYARIKNGDLLVLGATEELVGKSVIIGAGETVGEIVHVQ